MNTHKITLLTISVCMFVLAGCTSNPAKNTSRSKLIDEQVQQGSKHQLRGELYQALYKFKVAKKLGNNSKKLSGKISRLEDKIRKQTEKTYKKGIDYYKKNQARVARKYMLKVLKLDPYHKKAIHFLKQHYPQVYLNYHVQKNDSSMSIAKKLYDEPEAAYIVEYFSDEINPETSSTLVLPNLEHRLLASIAVSKKAAKQKNNNKLSPERYSSITNTDDKEHIDGLDQAEELLNKKDYKSSLKLIHQVLNKYPSNFKASELENRAYFEMGVIQYLNNELEKSYKTLSKVDYYYEGLSDTLVKRIPQIAHIKADRQLAFLKNQILFEQGKQLIAQSKYIEADKVFNKIDPQYINIDQEVNELMQKKRILADEYYIKGVNLFVKEQLEQAIEQWQLALRFNAKHKNASTNIKRARSLLEKLKKY